MSGEIYNTGEFYELIKRAARALRRHALWIGLTLVLLLAVAWLVIAVSVDLLIPLATTFRLAFAIAFWLLMLGGVGGLLLWPLLRRRRLEDVALRIERTVGNMHNRLLTVLDLHRSSPGSREQSNADMVTALIRQTHQKLRGFHIQQLIDRMPLLKSLLGLAGALGAAVLLTLIFRESATTALARILRPTADIPPLTWLQIAAPGDLAAPAGEPLTIAADIARGEVDSLALHLQQPDGQWVVYPMQRDGKKSFSYGLSGVTSDYRYKISGGGTWTSEYKIRMVPRPIVEAVATSIRLPTYMRLDEPIPVADDVHRIEAPLDAHVVFEATVSGDVARGEIVLLKRSVTTEQTSQDEEHVWFDDDLPADAETDHPWHWSTARAFTGIKSFTFGRGHLPLGFATRLAPLDVPAAGLFYLMVWLDPSDAPGRVSLQLQGPNQTRAYDWGEPSTPAAGQQPPTHVGPLPQPGGWARLEVPADALGSASAAVKLRGLKLEVDHGQVFFDRPGYLVRKVTPVERVATEVLDTRAMEKVAGPEPTADGERSGLWSGQVHVAADMLLSLRFYSSLGQASADREPLEVVATQDQAPSIVIERPAADVVLPAVQPLPVSARAIDDWGIEAVGTRVGLSETGLGQVRWIEDSAELVTSRLVTLAIDAQAEHLAPGQTLWYQLVVKDCKGQIGASKAYKLSIAQPDRAGAPETAKAPESLEPVRKQLAEMLKAPMKERESADFVASLPEALRESVDAEGQFRKPDGSLLDAEEIRKQVEAAQSQLTPEQKNRLNELIAELDRRQQEMKRLAETLKQAAQKSAASPLALDQESKLLAEFAGQAQQMAAELNPPTAAQGEAARLEREVKAERTAGDQSEQLAQLERELAQLETARQQMTADLRLAQQKLDDLTAQVAAAAAARQLTDLATDLESRGRKLQGMEQQTGNLARQSAAADDQHLAEISQSQSDLDRQATGAIDQLRGILGTASEPGSQPVAPWTPPGKPPLMALNKSATPADTSAVATPGAPPASQPGAPPASPAAIPAESGAATNQPGGATAGPDKTGGSDKASGRETAGSPDRANESGKAGPDKSWWDQPSGMPSGAGSTPGENDRGLAENNPGGADERGTATTAHPGQGKPTPRSQLTAHQQQIQQSLASNAGAALESAAAVRELAQRLKQAAASERSANDQGHADRGEMGGKQPDSGTPAGTQPGGNEQTGKNQPGQDQPGSNQPSGNQPNGNQPNGNQPNGNQPNGNQPNGNQPNGNQPNGNQPNGNQPNGNQPNGNQPNGNQPNGNQPNGNQPNGNQPNGNSANPPDGGESGLPEAGTPEQTGSDAERLLGDSATQQALAMAERMRAQSRSGKSTSRSSQIGQNQSSQPTQPTGSPGGNTVPSETGTHGGGLTSGRIPPGSDPRSRAQFYQLPPRLRGPLLEGMQERGPEGYQSMIDAYFRELNKEIK